MLCVIDEFTREALAESSGARLLLESSAHRSPSGTFSLLPQVLRPGVHRHDSARMDRRCRLLYCLHRAGENGTCEGFNSKLRDELIDGEMFFSLAEAQVLIEACRHHYNTVRPRTSLGYRPLAPEAIVPRSGTIAPWASAPAIGGARSLTSTMASAKAMH